MLAKTFRFEGFSSEDMEDQERYGDFSFEDLFHMTEEEKEMLAEEIAATDGTVELWIHTHFSDIEKPQTQQQIEEFELYQKQRDRFIKQGHKGNIPVIAFVESNPLVPGADEILEDYERYYRDLKENESRPSQILYVRTFSGDSVPCVTRQDDYIVLEEDTRVENWNEVGTLLAALGTKNLIIRGRDLAYIEKPANRLDSAYTLYVEKHPELLENSKETIRVPAKCVGHAIVNMEVRGFKILNSQLTYPETVKGEKSR